MKSFAARIKRVALAVMALSAMGVSSSVFAAVGETTAGIDITNTATVNYTVGSVAQTPVASNVATFKVDRKVDLTVTGGSPTTTNPGRVDQALIYTVANTGNDADTFTLGATNQGSDGFDTTGIEMYLDDGDNTFDSGDTLITAPLPLARDTSAVVFVVSDIPLTATNGQTAILQLAATTTQTASGGADDPNVVDVVFADAGNNGTENDDNNYTIEAATLSVVKSAAVVSDPVNGISPNAKAIPGAVVRYSIVVTNNGAAAAAAVTLTDNIPNNTTYVANSMTLDTTGTPVSLTDTGSDDAGTATGAPVTALSVVAGNVTGSGGTATVTFRVTVN
jgi:uncharacterized repeat protein (TIGR01451 family)